MPNVLFISKRQYTQKDLLDDKYGRLWEIPKGLSKLGVNIKGICLSYKNKQSGIIYTKPILWESVNLGNAILPGLLKYLWILKKEAKKTDIIFAASDSIYGIFGYFIAKHYNKKIIFDLYDNFEANFFGKLPVIRQLYKYVIRKSDIVICISTPLKKLIKSYGRETNTFVIENAISDNQFYPMGKKKCRNHFNIPNDAIIIGTAGALSKSRGIKILFRAFETIKKDYDNIYLTIAGPRDIKIPIDKKIIDLGILHYNDIPKFINTLDIAIICNIKSKFGEFCFPQKAYEIMACNIPLLSANVGSMKIFFSNYPGWLYQWDSPESLTQAIKSRLKNKKTDYQTLPTWDTISKKLKLIINKTLTNMAIQK